MKDEVYNKILNAYKQIFLNSIKYFVPTTVFMFCLMLPFVGGACFGNIGCVIAIAIDIPLVIGLVEYCFTRC